MAPATLVRGYARHTALDLTATLLSLVLLLACMRSVSSEPMPTMMCFLATCVARVEQ